jgi:cytochrome c oxidase subunit 2
MRNFFVSIISTLSKSIRAFLLLCLFFILSGLTLPPMNMPEGVTPTSREIFHLHMFALYICIGIGVVVFGMMLYCVLKFRQSKGSKAVPVHSSLTVEIIWTVIPFILLIALAIPSTRVLRDIHNTSKPDLNIKVTGYQWKWRYEYLDQGIKFYSNMSTPQAQVDGLEPKDRWFLLEVDKPLVVPIKEKIRLLVTSNDVIHNWWVPKLGVKQDAIPGYVNENWMYIEKPGTYRGQCGELCGVHHAYMPIVVKAVTKAEFARWVAAKGDPGALKASKKVPLKHYTQAELMMNGQKVYANHCVACHQKNGQGLPPTFPAIKGSALATGPINGHIHIILHGVKGSAMQAFEDQLSDTEIAEVITYQRNSWGNNAIITKLNKQMPNKGYDLVVQPQAVAAQRSAE